MNILMDTHTFIWSSISPQKLSTTAKKLIIDQNHNLFLSFASIWEMQIKLKLGKLRFDVPLSELLTIQQQVNQIQLLSIDLKHMALWESG